MNAPDIPSNESTRLAALCELNLLDTPAEVRFDRITRIAQRHFGVPIVLVSLLDAKRQWFKSRQGLDALETPRDISFCGHAILSDDVLYVPDARQDPRFSDNPLVTSGPGIRFYAGAPLHAPTGERVGTLCIVDAQPRAMSAADFAMLRDLADSVEAELQHTELEKSRSQLRSAENRLRAVIDTVVDGIITIDVDGVVQSFNPAAGRIFGYSAAEVTGRNVKMLMPEPFHGGHDGYLRNYLATGECKIIGKGREVTGRRKDGSTFPMELAVSHMEVNGARMFTGIVRDVTERKRIERIKNEFVSTVSHELRTPLTSIRGALSLLRGKHGAALPTEARKLVDIADRNSERLVLLINDILDLEKLEAERLVFDFKALDLGSLVKIALEANEGYAHRHGVRVRISEIPQGTAVHGDQHRLLQVFSNLLSNAIKYSRHGSEVVISVRRQNARHRISVQDHGRGIPPEFRSRMFQRFAQADGSDTREKGGTGLGLCVAKAIIERHGGTIDYVSEWGVGTEFFFELPAREEAVSAGHGQEESSPLLMG
ncbi:MAG: PAS domain S-box protein [Burkholderiales bacterium]